MPHLMTCDDMRCKDMLTMIGTLRQMSYPYDVMIYVKYMFEYDEICLMNDDMKGFLYD